MAHTRHLDALRWRGWTIAALAAAGVAFGVDGSASAGDVDLALKRSIELPEVEGRIDHMAYDPHAKRLVVAALENGSVEIIDLTKGERIKSIGGLAEPQSVAYVSATNRIVVSCGGDGLLRSFDATTFGAKETVAVGADADNVRLSSDAKTIVVGEGGGGLAFVDAATMVVSERLALPAHPEAIALDGSARVFVNVPGAPDGASVVVVDRAAHRVASTWRLKDVARNFPMALDAEHKRLYIGCRARARLLALDSETGAVVSTMECVGDADDVFVDAKTGRLFVVGGAGAIDVFATDDQRTYTKVASVTTATGARTALFVAETRTLYVAVPKRANQRAEIREYAVPG